MVYEKGGVSRLMALFCNILCAKKLLEMSCKT